MADEYGQIQVYSANPRAIMPIEEFHVPRRLARVIRQGKFQIRVNSAFEAVIRGCAKRDTTWISEEIVQIYCQLHARGWAHSVEAWQGDLLAGGLYGIAIGAAFFGESMFYEVSDASKVATVALVERLRERGYQLLDCQMMTANTSRYGARLIPKNEYLRLLSQALKTECRFA